MLEAIVEVGSCGGELSLITTSRVLYELREKADDDVGPSSQPNTVEFIRKSARP